MKEKIIKMAETIPFEDRPISKKRLSGIANFFGLYGGEHIAATEFVIGALLVMWGVKATDIFLGLIIGNILATLTYALICAPIAVDTRLTLYSYLKKVVGEKIQKILFKVIYERIFFVVRLYLKYLFEFLVIWFNLPRHLNTLRKSKKT